MTRDDSVSGIAKKNVHKRMFKQPPRARPRARCIEVNVAIREMDSIASRVASTRKVTRAESIHWDEVVVPALKTPTFLFKVAIGLRVA
jgi:hypothetical protein